MNINEIAERRPAGARWGGVGWGLGGAWELEPGPGERRGFSGRTLRARVRQKSTRLTRGETQERAVLSLAV